MSRVNLTPSEQNWLYENIADEIIGLIEQGTYRPGERIPSVRQLSQQRRVSVSTVLQAYTLLEDRGLIEARPQSGYYVRTRLAHAMPEPEISASADPSQVSVRDIAMMVLNDTLNPRLVHLGTAIPNPELLPTEKFSRILSGLARREAELGNQYIFPPGVEELRVQIAQRAVASGCNLSPNEIVITNGCIESVELCLRAVCKPGDIVAIESPLYFGLLQSLEAHNLRALEIPTHPRDGISLDALRFAIQHNPVRACLIISNFNNPLGSCIPDDHKQALVRLLAQHEIPLIENNIAGEIFFGEERPSVAKSYDRKGLVMLCTSYSKDVCPGYRIGWAAPGRFKSTVEWLKFTNNVATATLPQLALAQFLASGGYDHHLRRIRRAYARNVALMTQAVERYFPQGTRVTRPSGGFVLWVQLPQGVDSLELYRLALKGGITLTPGHIFSASQQFGDFFRLNAACWDKQIERALQDLGEMIEELARPPSRH